MHSESLVGISGQSEGQQGEVNSANHRLCGPRREGPNLSVGACNVTMSVRRIGEADIPALSSTWFPPRIRLGVQKDASRYCNERSARLPAFAVHRIQIVNIDIRTPWTFRSEGLQGANANLGMPEICTLAQDPEAARHTCRAAADSSPRHDPEDAHDVSAGTAIACASARCFQDDRERFDMSLRLALGLMRRTAPIRRVLSLCTRMVVVPTNPGAPRRSLRPID